MITDNQADWSHLALSVHSHGEEETNDLPTEEEHVDDICAKKPKCVALQYTTIDIETVPESSTETIEAIEYQRKWENDVEGWFKKSNYELTEHKTLDSKPVFDIEQGIERFAAYGRLDHKIYAWYMRQELRDSTATLSRHHYLFETYCEACARYLHPCNCKCEMEAGENECGQAFNGDLNLKRHQSFQHGSTPKNPPWSGHEVRVMYDLYLLGCSPNDISKVIPWRTEKILIRAIKQPMYGCQNCEKVVKTSSLLEKHSTADHGVQPTCYHCYKCDKVHGLQDWGHCLGGQRKLDLRDREEMNSFYEMQLEFLFLAQLKHPDNPRFWDLPKHPPTERSKFLSKLSKHLRSIIHRGVVADPLQHRMLTQLLGVVQCEEEFVSQGKGDTVDVSSGNLDWYRKLRSKAHNRDERPLLSALEMGLAV